MNVSAQYYYEEIARLLTLRPYRVKRAYALLVEVVNEATSQSTMLYAGVFARLHHLSASLNLDEQEYLRINNVRARWFRPQYKPSSNQWGRDLQALAQLVATIKSEEVPSELETVFSLLSPLEEQGRHTLKEACLRVIVQRYQGGECWVRCDGEGCTQPWRLCPTEEQRQEGWWQRLQAEVQLNLIDVTCGGEEIKARFIIVEPDFLVDVSSVAACFQAYGHHAALYPLQRIAPTETSRHMLLGNFASQLLDEAVHRLDMSYEQSISKFFQSNALSFVTCSDFKNQECRQEFHKNAIGQQKNLQQMAKEVLAKELGLRPDNTLLEPSFFCEMLGLQGRMDLLRSDLQVLVEQKSGKRDWNGAPSESHKVQMLLYMAMLHYAFGVRYTRLAPYLLYSRYVPKQALLRMNNIPVLLQRALGLRNEIVLREREMATSGARSYFDNLQLKSLHTQPCGSLWEMFVLPRWKAVLDPLQQAPPLEKDYFYRFHRFLILEQMYARIGYAGREGSGFAAAWLCSWEERLQAGRILAPLVLENQKGASGSEAVTEVRLLLAEEQAASSPQLPPNFRVGDIVVLYAYEQQRVPDLRKTMVHRATIAEISADSVLLRLRAPQTTQEVFSHDEKLHWAMEPDHMEAGNSALLKGLMAFLTHLPQRRALLLAQRPPLIDANQCCRLQHQNEEIQHMVEKALQARDFFLLMGPPGTGKTSVGLMSLVREELARPSQRILLGAFTNRAVDEICSKLVKEGLTFVRIGSSWGCAEDYQAQLLSEQIAPYKKLEEIEDFLRDTRIFVGTTASLSARTDLFRIAPFSLAIIDEASQLLEPHLLPLLMAEHLPGQAAIERFVLIGDHKQLPAVVQQNPQESEVKEKSLREIGINDCRRSLFERLIVSLPESCIHRFTRHGRMHPQVADFANRHFYGGSLTAIPLPHQTVEIPHSRICFYDCAPAPGAEESPKTNQAEATVIRELAVAEVERTLQHGGRFNPHSDLGIIVPYRHQIALVRKELLSTDYPELTQVTVDTVERFQGSEREVIIYGFTVSLEPQLNFLCNSQFVDESGQLIDRKLNVALTRSRQRTLLVGCGKLLRKVPLYAQLIDELPEGGAIFGDQKADDFRRSP